MNLEHAINLLMQNDRNATWYECKTKREIKEGLIEALKSYTKEEKTYIFYKYILDNLYKRTKNMQQ